MSEHGPEGASGDRPPMRLFVDARWTRTDVHDGISRYGANLIEALHELHPVTVLVHDTAQLRLLPAGVPHVLVNSPLSPRELWISRTLNRLGADVVFSPLQVIGGFRRRYALVLTLHDLIYYRHPKPPGFLPLFVRVVWRLYHRAYWPQRVLLNRADSVVTVSETTKELIARERLTRRPVTVVHNAPAEFAAESEGGPEDEADSVLDSPAASGSASHTGSGDGDAAAVVSGAQPHGTDTVQAGSQPAGAPLRDLVYMGSFMPYKNVETLLSGMAHLPGYRLHLLSRIASARRDELAALVPAGSEVVFRNGISDAGYKRLLTRAEALVTASHDEGFGLPVIEAMNAGTPVVCSDLPIFREVTGGHARFFPPDSSGDFAAAVRSVRDPAERVELTAAARAHANGFTWRSSARRLLALMRELDENGSRRKYG